MQCDKCVTDRSLCNGCRHNPKYADYPHKSLFMEYQPVCPRGYVDCVYDPAYIKHHHPEWYKELYGNMTPEDAAHKKGECYDKVKKDPDEEYWCYDDEDK